MAYDFSEFKKEVEGVHEWLVKEFTGIRTGRATPALFDNVAIESYGARTLIAHVASITTEGPRSLRISPWDKKHIKEIEKAITASDLGVSVATDDMGLRISFPELTSERRVLLKKLANEKLEHAKVSIRHERERVLNDIQEKCKEGELTEDDKFRLKDEVQKMVDTAIMKLEEVNVKKDKEISE
jgi:ribosome recycling factor